jgi:hypothetical protein
MKIKVLVLLFFCFLKTVYFQKNAIQLDQDVLFFIQGKDSLVDEVFKQQEKYKLQIIYGQTKHVGVDSVNVVNSKLSSVESYFYPASAIKLPCAMLTMEKLNKLDIPNEHYFRIGGEFFCGNMSHVNNSNKYKSSYFDMIKIMLTVSDNAAYNSVYEFLTPRYITNQLMRRDLKSINIYKRFAGCNVTENLKTNSIDFFNKDDNFLHRQEASVMGLTEMAEKYKYTSAKLIGENHESNSTVVSKPYDFNYNIEASLVDLHEGLVRLVYPNSTLPEFSWKINPNDRDFVLKHLGQYPKELNIPKYSDTLKYPDNLYKYIALGNQTNLSNTHLRTFSKLGLSYGFVTETAYVVDFTENIDFFLSISMYVNENKTVNDNQYEYETVARPFCAKIGELLIEYEKSKSTELSKDLSYFKNLFKN